MKLLPLLIFAFVACWFAPLSCQAISKSRDAALFGPARLSWPAVELDYHRGLEAGQTAGELNAEEVDGFKARGDQLELALASGSRADVRLIPWDVMEPWADRGIDDKLAAPDDDPEKVGPTNAMSLRKQLNSFSKTIYRLQE